VRRPHPKGLRRFDGDTGLKPISSKIAREMTTAARSVRAALLFIIFLLAARLCPAYSVLTHEEIVDLLWQDQIQPLLTKRFPSATEEDLRKAHAYAYGGCLIQDMGYYPFGSKYFSDLTHYVRSGDFVDNPDSRIGGFERVRILRWARFRTTRPTTVGTPRSIGS
jgi:hypothetical protein